MSDVTQEGHKECDLLHAYRLMYTPISPVLGMPDCWITLSLLLSALILDCPPEFELVTTLWQWTYPCLLLCFQSVDEKEDLPSFFFGPVSCTNVFVDHPFCFMC